MGNIFTVSTTVTNAAGQHVVEAYYCEGPGFANGTVAGRIGDLTMSDVYANAYGGLGNPPPKCSDRCAKADYPNDQDGYKQCAGLAPTGLVGNPRVGNHVITVWRGSGTTSTSTSSTSTTSSAKYDFESDAQGWTPGSHSSSQKASGNYSLRFDVASGEHTTGVNPSGMSGLAGGKTVTMKVWIPSSGVTAVDPYIMSGSYTWSDSWFDASTLTKGAWNTVKTTIPSGATLPLAGIGLKIVANASVTVYIDSVSW